MSLAVPSLPGSLIAAVGELAGPDVAVSGGMIESWTCCLAPQEEKAVARAVPRRRQEFMAGRAAARHAMAKLGLLPQPLPRRADGPPLWPDGITGSISHGADHVLAVVGRIGPELRALGLDIERNESLTLDIVAEVCGPGEDEARASAVFSAKEAVYKAQFMLTRELLDFADLHVRFDDRGRFSCVFQKDAGCFSRGDRLMGMQLSSPLCIISVVRL